MITRAQTDYSYQLVRGARMMKRRGGLGQPNAPGCMSSSDFYAAIGPLANCDPHDVNCVMCNTQQSNAVSNLVDSGCIAPGTPISFSCDSSPAAMSAFQSNNPLAVNATVGTGSSAFVATGPTVTMAQPGTQAAGFFGGPAGTVAGNPPAYRYLTQTGASAQNPTNQQTTATPAPPPNVVLSPPPPSTSVVSPMPPGWMAGSVVSNSLLNPMSLLAQSSGTSIPVQTSGAATSTGNWFTDPTQELINGLPNWALIAIGGAGLFIIVDIAARRK